MKCSVMLHFIWVFTVCQITRLGGTSFVDLFCFLCLVLAMSLCASVYMCFVVTCWERSNLFALVSGV